MERCKGTEILWDSKNAAKEFFHCKITAENGPSERLGNVPGPDHRPPGSSKQLCQLTIHASASCNSPHDTIASSNLVSYVRTLVHYRTFWMTCCTTFCTPLLARETRASRTGSTTTSKLEEAFAALRRRVDPADLVARTSMEGPVSILASCAGS